MNAPSFSTSMRTLLPAFSAFLLVCAGAAQATSSAYRIDPAHSRAAFSVRLIWWQNVVGQFEDVQGNVRVDAEDQMARVHAHIRVDSVRVKPAHYRKRLLGDHFFDAETYPYITFVSAPMSLPQLRQGRQHLKGDLTLHGVTRPMTLQLFDTRCPGASLDGCTLHLRGWLDRTRFGMREHRTMVSTRVNLDLVIRLRSEQAETERSPPPVATKDASSG